MTPKNARPEKEIQRAILDYLALVPGVVVWRNNVGAMFGQHKGKRWAVRFGAPGLSDIIGWRSEVLGDKSHQWRSRPVFLAIEVKRPGGKLSKEQAAFLNRVMQAGGIAFVAESVDDVSRALGLP